MYELIEQCADLKRRWHHAIEVEKFRFEIENALSKPLEAVLPENHKEGDFIPHETNEAYYAAIYDSDVWDESNFELAENTDFALALALQYRETSEKTWVALEAMPKNVRHPIMGGFGCPICTCRCIPLPSKEVNCSDSFVVLCSKEPSHVYTWLPWGG